MHIRSLLAAALIVLPSFAVAVEVPVGRWTLVGRMCAKGGPYTGGRYEAVPNPVTMSIDRTSYSSDLVPASRCMLKKSGSMQIEDGQLKQCVTEVSFGDDISGCSEGHVEHIYALDARLKRGDSICHNPNFEVAVFFGRKVLMMRETNRSFCGTQDEQISFFEEN